MSQNGKGSNTAKRTNFKLFNQNFDNIDWGNKESTTAPTLPPDVQERIDDVKHSIENYESVLREREGNDETGK